MNAEQIKTTLLFPVRDTYARRQFLVASLIMLAGMIIPLIPIFFLMGYAARIARQIVLDKKEPSMTEWDNWSEFFVDGARIFGIRLILFLPIVILAMGAMFFFILTPALLSSLNQQASQNLSPLTGVSFFIGMMIFLLIMILSLPLQIVIAVAETHVAVKSSFSAGFQFKEWWPILRKGIGPFMIVYVIMFAISFIFMIAIQISIFTIVLICILPFILFPYSAYLMLILQALYAQAYRQALAV